MRRHAIIRFGVLTAITATSLAVIGCGGSGEAPPASISSPTSTSSSGNDATTTPSAQRPSVSDSAHASTKAVEVEFEFDAGSVTVQLFPDKAPDTVHNFLNYYVYRNHYDNSLIHYITEDMMIGGGYDAKQKPTPTYGPIVNESDNGLSNERGTLAMSRHPDFPDSATSQFFFNLGDNTGLDHQAAEDGVSVGGNGYCVFGKVTKGMDVLDKLAQTPTTDNDQFVNFPEQPVVVRAIRRLP